MLALEIVDLETRALERILVVLATLDLEIPGLEIVDSEMLDLDGNLEVGEGEGLIILLVKMLFG